jgi:hypothetical protein
MLSSKRLIPALAATALIGALAAPAALGSTTQESIIQDNGYVQSNPAAALATFKSLGVTRLKITIFWNSFAPKPNAPKAPKGFKPTDPASYPAKSWAWLDTTIRLAKQDGIQVGLQPDAPAPDWAAGAGYKQHPVFKGSWNPSWTAFKAFVQALGTRYSGSYKPKKNEKALPRVGWWSIWNEPNFGFSLQPQTLDKGKTLHSAAEYRQLVRGAWQGLVATGHKNDTILVGEIAPRGVGNTNTKSWSAYNPGLGQMSLALVFMSQLYCVGQNGKPMTGKTAKTFSCPGSVAKFKQQNPALFQSAGWAIHPYGQGTPPNETTYDCPGRTFCQSPGNKKRNPYFADFASIPTVTKMMDRFQRLYGSSKKMQLWNTEFGYWSVPPTKVDPVKQKGQAISQQTAAFYMNWAEYLSYQNPRLMSYSQYQFVDPITDVWGSGLLTSKGKQKPEYDAFMVPFFMPTTKASHATTLTVWGGIRPTAYLGASAKTRPQAKIEFKPLGGSSGGGKALSTGSTGAVGASGSSGSGTSGSGSKAPKGSNMDGAYTILQTVKIASKRGYFSVKRAFTKSGTVRIAWTMPDGKTVYSRTQQIAIG